jgi:hypothetical protein
MIIAIFVILTLLLLPDLYIYGVFLRNIPLVWKLLFFAPSLVALLSILSVKFFGLNNTITTIFLVVLLCFALPKMLFMAFSLIAKLLGLWSISSYNVVTICGIVAASIVSVIGLYGLTIGWKHLETKQVDLYFDNLPDAFDGYKIAHISDLHVGSYGDNTKFIQKIVDQVNKENPDLVAFTGDIVNTEPEELLPFTHTLSLLHAKDGIVSVLGNHDYCLYGDRSRWSDVREGGLKVAEIEQTMGWKVLMNESLVVERDSARIAIVGVENTGKPPFPQIGNLPKAVSGVTHYDTAKCDDELFSILLSHDPSHWRMEVVPKTDIPLTLSGHTHAAQFKIGNWSPVTWMYKEWSGLYQSDNQQLYISEGIGGTLPFRFGSSPLIVVLTLRKRS